MEEIKVIVKMELDPDGKKAVALFFPEDKVTPGNIAGWEPNCGHFEASMGYFWNLRPPRAEEEEAVDRVINLYEVGPDSGFTLVRIKRDSQLMRCERWKRIDTTANKESA